MSDTLPDQAAQRAAGIAAAAGADDYAGQVQGCPVELSWYEMRLIDEVENPIAGVQVNLTTPGGPATLPTSGDGIVRVDQVPAGTATACLASIPQCAGVMSGWQHNERRKTRLPDPEPLFQLATLSRVGTYSFPDAHRFTLMLVVRPDIFHAAETPGWDGLTRADPTGPWTAAFAATNKLAMFSDATGSTLAVIGPSQDAKVPKELPPPDRLPAPVPPASTYVVQPGDTLSAIAARLLGDASRWTEIWDLNKTSYPGRSPDLIYPGDVFALPDADQVDTGWFDVQAIPWPSFPPDPDPPSWLQAEIDRLHEALYDGDFDTVADILVRIPVQAPLPPAPDWPTAEGEAALFYNNMVGNASDGDWDLLPSDGDDDGGSDDAPTSPVA